MWSNGDRPGVVCAAGQQHAISYFLREPLARTRRLLRGNKSYLAHLHRLRNVPLPHRFLRRYGATFQIPGQQAIQKLFHSDARSRVIATFHFGDFVFGLSHLSRLAPPSRRQYFLSLQAQTPVCFDNIHKAFGSTPGSGPRELLKAASSSTELAGLLREPGVDLFLFVDLPPGHGEVCEVDFLGRRAVFPRGAATLAVFNRVPLLPVLCLMRRGSNCVLVGPQLEPDSPLQSEPQCRISQLTQALVRLLELFPGEFAQWRYLTLLPDYFCSAADKRQLP